MTTKRTLRIALTLGAVLAGLLALVSVHAPRVKADAYSSHLIYGPSAITDSPTIAIAGGTATSGVTPTSGMHRAEIQWTFLTVSGSYSGCTVQAKTSLDGANFLTLGSAVSVTATSNAVNTWSVIEQLGTTSVTTSAVSSTAALSFGRTTEYVFACSGYGTAAPVSIAAIYK